MQTTTTTETTSPFAILDDACERIEEVHDLTDAERDQMAARYGRRLVYLPMGGEAGDRVTVDEDGEAEVVPTTDLLTIQEIGELLEERDVSPSRFWEHAMGGDRAPLPRDVVERCIAEMGED